MKEEIANRLGSVFAGLFLFFFGLPFTLVPFMMYNDGVIDPDFPIASLFMICFVLPFLAGGLLIQYLGLNMMRGGDRGRKEAIQMPELLSLGPNESDGADSEGWWTEK